MRKSARTLMFVCCAIGAAQCALADESAIVANIAEFLRTVDPKHRADLAQQIEADAAFDRSKMSSWLHRAATFEPLEAGPRSVQVPVDNGEIRAVALRIPRDYDPKKPWPLIYALHGTGGSGEQIISYVEHILKGDVEQYVLAAPTAYGQRVIGQGGPASAEHLQMLLAVKKLAHIDSDRVFVTGYSLGGHTAWTLAVLHADQFAAALPMAGSFLLPDVDKLWEDFLPNLISTHLLCCWGEKDTKGVEGTIESEHGGIAGLNRRLIALAVKQGVAAIGHEDAGKGHGDIRPPPELLDNALRKQRAHYPKKVQQTFRRTYQSHAYWLEANEWKGDNWGDSDFKGTLKPGEDPKAALLREIRSRLGQLSGSTDGQSITVSRKHVDDVTIWIGDTSDTGFDWTQPVLIKVSGNKAYEGPLKPNLLLCLSAAAKTYDFERLRWAGVRYKGGSKGEVLRTLR